MPKQKDLKRLTRARMQKTGESYTAARATLLAKKARRSARREDVSPAPAPPPAAAPDYAALAGMSDATVEAKTGCTWERWVAALDYQGAAEWSHGEIAAHVHEKYGIPGWWAQTVTVGYERIRGLRDKGQRRDGSYEANKSRTYPVPLATLYGAFATPARRRSWLPEPGVVVRKATSGRSMRLAWRHTAGDWVRSRTRPSTPSSSWLPAAVPRRSCSRQLWTAASFRVTIACEPRQSVASISEIGHVPSAFWNRCNIRIRWTLPTDADSRRRGLRERPIPSSGPWFRD